MTTVALTYAIGAAPVEYRRDFLRKAAEHGDCPGSALTAAVRLATPGIDEAIRRQAWDELVLDVARLADLGVGLEWRDVVPGAPPSQGYSIAAEVLEQAIAEHLEALVPSGGAS